MGIDKKFTIKKLEKIISPYSSFYVGSKDSFAEMNIGYVIDWANRMKDIYGWEYVVEHIFVKKSDNIISISKLKDNSTALRN